MNLLRRLSPLAALTIALIASGGCGSNPDCKSNCGSGTTGSTGSSGSSGTQGSTGSGSSSSGSSGTTGFTPAQHDEEEIPFQNGIVFDHPTLVAVTFSDDPNRAEIESLGAFLTGSNWLTAVGHEYGIQSASALNAELPFPSPSSIEDTDLQADIAGWISDGGLPSGDFDAGAQYIYLVYFPDPQALQVDGAPLCQFSGGGYHVENSGSGPDFSYGVIAACGEPGFTTAQQLELNTSHEFIEAATDPRPITAPGYSLRDLNDPWTEIGGEVADLCAYTPSVTESGHRLTQVWSNQRSLAGEAPCVPDNGQPYIDVGVTPGPYQRVAAGQTAQFTLTGWSSAPAGTWGIYAAPYEGTISPEVSVSVDSIDNGGTAQLTVTVPPDAGSGDYSIVYVGSESAGSSDYNGQAVEVYVK